MTAELTGNANTNKECQMWYAIGVITLTVLALVAGTVAVVRAFTNGYGEEEDVQYHPRRRRDHVPGRRLRTPDPPRR